jgi:ATP-binding cassette subfamily B protein
MIACGVLVSLIDIVVPLLVRWVIDGPVRHGDTKGLLLIGVLALVFGVGEAGLVFLRRWTVANGALGIETDLRDDLYRRLQRLPLDFHDRWQSGQLVSRMSSDTSAIRRFVSFGFVFLVINMLTVLVVGVVLIVIDPLLGGIVMFAGVPLVMLTTHYERRYKVQIRAVQDQQGDVATEVEESALGIRSIKAFGRQRTVFDRFDGKAERLRVLQVSQIRTLADLWAVIMTQPGLVLGLIVLFGAIAVENGTLSLGTLVAFAALYQIMVWPIESLGWLLANAQEANSAAERVYEVLDAPITVTDPDEPITDATSAEVTNNSVPPADPASATSSPVADARPEVSRETSAPAAAPAAPTSGARAGGTRGARLVFERVSFRYPRADADVLTGVDLVVEPGETLAIVGATGSGKTTLTALVPRLYDVTGGKVTLDGVDVRRLRLADLRSRVACAFEEPTLFSASVRENIVMGRFDATDAQIREAIAIAQADFVDDLPWGLDTRVGEQGMTLSGGQRQRLALARAVIGRPDLLVLDDPLSALDVATEGLVEAALREVLTGTTGLIVAHRPSTVLLADRVALLHEGRIKAVGTHHELLRDVPEYRDILSQSSDLVELGEAEGAR